MLGTLPKDFSQAATSQGYFPKWQLPNSAISHAANSQVCSSRSARPLPPFQPAAPQRPYLPLEKWDIVTWEDTLEKMP